MENPQSLEKFPDENYLHLLQVFEPGKVITNLLAICLLQTTLELSMESTHEINSIFMK